MILCKQKNKDDKIFACGNTLPKIYIHSITLMYLYIHMWETYILMEKHIHRQSESSIFIVCRKILSTLGNLLWEYSLQCQIQCYHFWKWLLSLWTALDSFEALRVKYDPNIIWKKMTASNQNSNNEWFLWQLHADPIFEYSKIFEQSKQVAKLVNQRKTGKKCVATQSRIYR